jgi:hypothetical protein
MGVRAILGAALTAAGLALVVGVSLTSASSTESIDHLRLVGDDGQRWKIDGEADTVKADLQSVPGHNAFWFAWSAFHPGSEVWGDKPIPSAVVRADVEGKCTVPCEEIFQGCSGRDCIPPLDAPKMVAADSADAGYLGDLDMVLGVRTAKGPRAYPHNVLWWHEIVNEEVAGQAYAITFCPLTGSGLKFDRSAFVRGKTVRLGVSGLLYNSNLVMWDRETESLWSQMRLEAITGPKMKTDSPLQGVLEMTWKAWKTLHPDTLVVSSETGYARDYQRYPYQDYRTNHSNTFRGTNPKPDARFKNKALVFGVVVNGKAKAYVWNSVFAKLGNSGIIEDEIDGIPILVVFHRPSRFFHAFYRKTHLTLGTR